MKTLHCFLAVVLLAILAPTLLFAETKISLITISPGTLIFSAFGHSAILIEDTEKRSEKTYFEFGFVEPGTIFSQKNPIDSLTEMFNNQISTKPRELPYQQRFLGLYLARPTFNEVFVNELLLSDEQKKYFLDQLQIELKKGSYFYNNFNANCTTKLRDIIFDAKIVAADKIKTLQDAVTNPALGADGKPASFEDLAYETMDVAAQRSLKGSLIMVSDTDAKRPEFKDAIELLDKLGVPQEFATDATSSASKKFHESIESAGWKFSLLGNISAFSKLSAAFKNYFFAPINTAKPISEWDGLFLPARLRKALLAHGLISETKQRMRATNVPVPKPVPAVLVPVPAPTPDPAPPAPTPGDLPTPILHEISE